eukprot:31973_1
MSTFMQLKSYPFVQHGSYSTSIPQVLNNEELLIVPYTTGANLLYKYNIKNNEFYPYLKYPNGLDTRYNTASLNTNKTLLYILNTNGKVIEVDLKKETFTTFNGYSAGVGFGMLLCGAHAKSLFINGQFHVFGGWYRQTASHFIWDKQQQILKEIYKYKFIDINHALHKHAVLHIKRRKSVLIIVESQSFSDKIYEYSLMTNECNLLPLKLTDEMFDPYCVVSKNEQFVIINGNNSSDKCTINILDLKQMVIRESKVNIPMCDETRVLQPVIINDDNMDELCVFGYVHKLWKLPQFTNMQQIPFYLIKLIKCWYSNEIIHIFNTSGPGHWAINLDEILKR